MSGRQVRLRKEARLLFWAWCVVVFVGVLTWFPDSWISNPFSPNWRTLLVTFGPITSLGFWIGIPLLATLPLGAELQHGTLSLLLSQPNDREKMWTEKWIVMGTAVLSASLIYWFPRVVFQHELWSSMFAGIWMITAACSATFWTLTARSTIGGLILNLFPGFVMITLWNVASWLLGSRPASSETRCALLIGAGGLAYAFAMLWLGSRKLVQFEATGQFAGNDLLATSPNAVHMGLMKFMRCRPAGPWLNLLRKEARLLLPALLLAFACIVIVLCLAAFQLLPGISRERLAIIAGAVVIISNSLSIVLAGSLSMGEERTLGTQSWNQTLPVSTGLLWLVKFVASIFVSFGSLVLTVALAQFVFGEPFTRLLPGRPIEQFLFSALLTFAAFWCSCASRER
jgi:hypothetical protein